MAQQPPVDHGLFIVEAVRSHSDTPNAVGFLWTSDQLVAVTSTWQHKMQMADFLVPAGFEPANPKKERPQTHALDRVATYIGSTWS